MTRRIIFADGFEAENEGSDTTYSYTRLTGFGSSKWQASNSGSNTSYYYYRISGNLRGKFLVHVTSKSHSATTAYHAIYNRLPFIVGEDQTIRFSFFTLMGGAGETTNPNMGAFGIRSDMSPPETVSWASTESYIFNARLNYSILMPSSLGESEAVVTSFGNSSWRHVEIIYYKKANAHEVAFYIDGNLISHRTSSATSWGTELYLKLCLRTGGGTNLNGGGSSSQSTYYDDVVVMLEDGKNMTPVGPMIIRGPANIKLVEKSGFVPSAKTVIDSMITTTTTPSTSLTNLNEELIIDVEMPQIAAANIEGVLVDVYGIDENISKYPLKFDVGSSPINLTEAASMRLRSGFESTISSIIQKESLPTTIVTNETVDPHFNNVFLQPITNGLSGQGTIWNATPQGLLNGKPMKVRNVTLNTVNKVSETASLMFSSGSISYIRAFNSSAYSLGSSDFTFEAWLHPTDVSTTKIILVRYALSQIPVVYGIVIVSGKLQFFYNTAYQGSSWNSGAGTRVNSISSIPVNEWTHVAVVRESGILKIYFNGVLDVSSTATTAFYDTSTELYLGGHPNDSTANSFSGYMDCVRFTNNVARYSGTFTPPTSQFDYPSAQLTFRART